MSKESTQPFNINDQTGQPSHRPEHDKQSDEVDEQLDDEDAEPITPADTASDAED
jgi:hypothetical protein